MGLPYMPISWGGLRGQCRHIWHTWSVWVMPRRSHQEILVNVDADNICGPGFIEDVTRRIYILRAIC